MMSNSNYSIFLRLKPVHTAYGAICMPIRKLLMHGSWAWDVNGRDRDETETSASRDRDKTETLTIFLETRPRRDVGTSRDRLETETTNLVGGLSSDSSYLGHSEDTLINW